MKEIEMMNKARELAKSYTVLVKMKKTHNPMLMLQTCYGRYPSLVLSPLRAEGSCATFGQLGLPMVTIDGVVMEAYDKYCRGAKEVKVTTPHSFSIDFGKTWISPDQFYALT